MIGQSIKNTLGQNKIQSSLAGSRNSLSSNTGQANGYRHEATPGGTTGAGIAKAQAASDELNAKDAGKGGDVSTETEKGTAQSMKEGAAAGKLVGSATGAVVSAMTTTTTGAATGAATGAKLGSNFGAYGFVAGAVVGGLISLM